MDSLHTISLESDSRIEINFDGGDLSSDAGLLIFKEFMLFDIDSTRKKLPPKSLRMYKKLVT